MSIFTNPVQIPLEQEARWLSLSSSLRTSVAADGSTVPSVVAQNGFVAVAPLVDNAQVRLPDLHGAQTNPMPIVVSLTNTSLVFTVRVTATPGDALTGSPYPLLPQQTLSFLRMPGTQTWSVAA